MSSKNSLNSLKEIQKKKYFRLKSGTFFNFENADTQITPDLMNQILDWMQDGGLNTITQFRALPVQERKLYDNALRLLIDECSFSMKKDPNDIEKIIFANLEK